MINLIYRNAKCTLVPIHVVPFFKEIVPIRTGLLRQLIVIVSPSDSLSCPSVTISVTFTERSMPLTFSRGLECLLYWLLADDYWWTLVNKIIILNGVKLQKEIMVMKSYPEHSLTCNIIIISQPFYTDGSHQSTDMANLKRVEVNRIHGLGRNNTHIRGIRGNKTTLQVQVSIQNIYCPDNDSAWFIGH